MGRRSDYTRDDVVRALRALGVKNGDVIFTHAAVALLGFPDVGLDEEQVASLYLSAFLEVLGPSGVWLLPSFTYSYTVGEVFDPAVTPPVPAMGTLSTKLWRHPDAVRSLDPIFSVIGFGERASEFVQGVPESCFGEDSVFGRLSDADAAVCNIGIGSHGTVLHAIEQAIGVSYRYPKWFNGQTVIDGQARETSIMYNVRDLGQPRHDAYFMRLDRDGRQDGSVRSERVGRGEINLIRVRRMEELVRRGLSQDPEYLVVGDRAAP